MEQGTLKIVIKGVQDLWEVTAVCQKARTGRTESK